MKYSVKHADPASVREILTGIWSANITMWGDRQKRLQWYYLDNPAGRGAAFLLEHEATSRSAECVGSAGIGVRQFHRNGVPLQAATLVHFAVNRSHRTVLPALTLQRAVHSYAQAHFDLAYGFAQPISVGVFRRIGYREIGRMARYVRVLRSREYLYRRVPVSPVSCVGGVVFDGLSRALEFQRSLRAPTSLRIQWLRGVDPRFDQLWKESHALYPMIGHRGADFLRWRFVENPNAQADIATLVHARSGRLLAYAVVAEEEPGSALIRDFLAATRRDLGVLFDRLIPELRTRGFASIELHFFGPNWVSTLLRRHGFRYRDATTTVIVDHGNGRPPTGAAIGLEPETWYLTHADDDE